MAKRRAATKNNNRACDNTARTQMASYPNRIVMYVTAVIWIRCNCSLSVPCRRSSTRGGRCCPCGAGRSSLGLCLGISSFQKACPQLLVLDSEGSTIGSAGSCCRNLACEQPLQEVLVRHPPPLDSKRGATKVHITFHADGSQFLWL